MARSCLTVCLSFGPAGLKILSEDRLGHLQSVVDYLVGAAHAAGNPLPGN
jgi:hypothetical protein